MRTLPHNDDAERAILGAILLNEEAYDSVSQLVGASDFYHPANAEIFTAISRMKESASGFAVDIVTLVDYLKKQDRLEKAGGIAYVSSLTDSNAIISNAEQYAKIVRELSIRRQVIALTTDVNSAAYDEVNDIYDLLDSSENSLMKLSEEGSLDKADYSISSIVSGVIDTMMRRIEGTAEDDSVPTGFQILDKYTNGGFKPQDYVVVAARPGIGKTAFGVSMIRNMIREYRKSVAFFSLEMPASQITVRLLGTISRVNTRNISMGDLAEDEMTRVVDAANSLYPLPLYIIDVPNIKLSDLRAKARMLRRDKKIDCIVIDYIGLIDPGLDPRTPRHEVIATVSKSLKQLARELNIPIIVLCQVSRDSEEREPMLSNLRDSGSIEQDADVVMFIHRKRALSEEDKQKLAKDANGKAVLQVSKIIVAKQRNGETGSFKVGYNANTTSFEEVSQSEEFIEPVLPDKKGYDKK